MYFSPNVQILYRAVVPSHEVLLCPPTGKRALAGKRWSDPRKAVLPSFDFVLWDRNMIQSFTFRAQPFLRCLWENCLGTAMRV